MIRINKGAILSSVMLVLIYSCNSSSINKLENEKHTIDSTLTELREEQTKAISFQLFLNDSSDKLKGYGYDILVDSNRYIHQTNLPAASGNQIFKTEEEAKKVASFVCYKIRNKIVPPTVTVLDLDSLGITVKELQ